jgi:hypothetical protein
MLAMKTALVGLALALSVAASASPGFAQTRQDRNGAEERAIHECSIRARKEFPREYTDETDNYYAYRACMGEHGFMNQ